jgi:hypothetical protein
MLSTLIKYWAKLLLITIIIPCCSVNKDTSSDFNIKNYIRYQRAIANSVYPEKSIVVSTLIAITDQNTDLIWKIINNEKYILVTSWKQDIKFYKLDTFYNTGNYPIWVTTAPELKKRFHTEAVKDTVLRLKQLLGLPPNSTYNYFVEFWVKPEDLFRPCPDNEITDSKCETCFPQETDSIYIKWFNDNRISRFYNCNLQNQYPWTQLGYTYDWSPKNKKHIGLSEFVIKANKNIYVKAISTTSEYLKTK